MRSQFMELKVQWPLANPDIFLSDTAALSCYELRPVGTFLNQFGFAFMVKVSQSQNKFVAS